MEVPAGEPQPPPPFDAADATKPRRLVQVILHGDIPAGDELFRTFLTQGSGNITTTQQLLINHRGMDYSRWAPKATQAYYVDGQPYFVSLVHANGGRYRGIPFPPIVNAGDDVHVHLINMAAPEAQAEWDAAMLNDMVNMVVAYTPKNVSKGTGVLAPLAVATETWKRGGWYTEMSDLSISSIREFLQDAISLQVRWKLDRMQLIQEENARATRTHAEKKAQRSTMARFYTAFFSFLFDVFQLAIATMDVITDIWVAVNYYQENEMTFFWIAVVDIAVAQMCYTAFFVFLYCNYGKTWSRRFLVFFVMLPFGQLIPLLIYIESHKFKVVSNIFRALDLTEENHRAEDPNEDPLSAYLKQKFFSHMGFYLESLVEAIPQSILQMVAIVVTGQVSVINVVSIAISIFSVAAKGLMMSYSIHRPTFIFSFLCVIYDVFSVFTTVSWLFYKPPDDPWPQVGVFYFNGNLNVFTAIWFWKQGIFVILCAFVGLNLYIFKFLDRTGYGCRCCFGQYHNKESDRLFPMFLMFWGGCFIFLPVMIVMEGTKFAPLPLIVFRSFDSPHGRQMPFYGPFFKFMMKGEFMEKLYSANLVTARFHIRESANQYVKAVDDPLYNNNGANIASDMIQYTYATPYEKYSLSGIRDAFGLSYRKYKLSKERARREKMERRAQEEQERRRREEEIARGAAEAQRRMEDPNYNPDLDYDPYPNMYRIPAQPYVYRRELIEKYETFVMGSGFLLVPIWILSNIYSLLYPFLCLFSLDWNKPAALQRAFTIFLLVVLFIKLCLAPSVIRFRKSVSYTQFYWMYMRPTYWLTNIYQQFERLQLHKAAKRAPAGGSFDTGLAARRLPMEHVPGPYHQGWEEGLGATLGKYIVNGSYVGQAYQGFVLAHHQYRGEVMDMYQLAQQIPAGQYYNFMNGYYDDNHYYNEQNGDVLEVWMRRFVDPNFVDPVVNPPPPPAMPPAPEPDANPPAAKGKRRPGLSIVVPETPPDVLNQSNQRMLMPPMPRSAREHVIHSPNEAQWQTTIDVDQPVAEWHTSGAQVVIDQFLANRPRLAALLTPMSARPVTPGGTMRRFDAFHDSDDEKDNGTKGDRSRGDKRSPTGAGVGGMTPRGGRTPSSGVGSVATVSSGSTAQQQQQARPPTSSGGGRASAASVDGVSPQAATAPSDVTVVVVAPGLAENAGSSGAAAVDEGGQKRDGSGSSSSSSDSDSSSSS